MTEAAIEKLISSFLKDFNKMCDTERKDFLIREKLVTFESGTSIKKYNVTYELKSKSDNWSIDAVTKGWWIFKTRFPLLKITRKDQKITFSGLYTESIKPFDSANLKENLDKYISICKALPQDAFVRV